MRKGAQFHQDTPLTPPWGLGRGIPASHGSDGTERLSALKRSCYFRLSLSEFLRC